MKVHLVPRNGDKPIVSLAIEIDTETDTVGIANRPVVMLVAWNRHVGSIDHGCCLQWSYLLLLYWPMIARVAMKVVCSSSAALDIVLAEDDI